MAFAAPPYRPAAQQAAALPQGRRVRAQLTDSVELAATLVPWSIDENTSIVADAVALIPSLLLPAMLSQRTRRTLTRVLKCRVLTCGWMQKRESRGLCGPSISTLPFFHRGDSLLCLPPPKVLCNNAVTHPP